MKHILFFIYISFFSVTVFAQQADSIPCPVIKLQGPPGQSIPAGKEAAFSVKAFKKDFTNGQSISYQWVISNGSILRGQNSRSVAIDTKGLDGQQITAAVIITGLAPGCPSTSNMAVNVVTPIILVEQKRVGVSSPRSF